MAVMGTNAVRRLFGIPIHAVTMSGAGPPARWIAPSTPPPPANRLFAALTRASTCWRVMSSWLSSSD